MKFAIDTYRDVMSGPVERRAHAIFTFALWFVAGAFIVSTAQLAVAPFDSVLVSMVGGAVISALAAAVKLV